MTSKRNISAPNEAETLSNVLKIVIFARLDFLSGVQRFHTEIGPKTATLAPHGSEVYQGIGDFGGINGDVKESISGAPISMSLALTGVDAGLVNTTLVDDYFRRDADIGIGMEDETGTLVDDPVILFSGYMDKAEISMTKGQGQIQLGLESRATNLLTSADLRFTNEDKQGSNPGDQGGEYIFRMADLILKWGVVGTFGSGIFRPAPRGKGRGRGRK